MPGFAEFPVEFKEFPKIARLSRDIVVTEKIDGTNAQVCISDDGLEIRAGSRNRFLTESADNFGFAKWVKANETELIKLGPGIHYGEYWGQGIQRGYGLKEKRFSLFNVHRWGTDRPACCHVVPTLYTGPFDMAAIDSVINKLTDHGSVAAPGFMNPEGIVVYHTAGGHLYKKTVVGDEKGKWDQVA